MLLFGENSLLKKWLGAVSEESLLDLIILLRVLSIVPILIELPREVSLGVVLEVSDGDDRHIDLLVKEIAFNEDRLFLLCRLRR